MRVACQYPHYTVYRADLPRFDWNNPEQTVKQDVRKDEYVLVFSSLSDDWVYLYRPLLEHHIKRGRAG